LADWFALRRALFQVGHDRLGVCGVREQLHRFGIADRSDRCDDERSLGSK
jgi:hypothetical protein